MPKETPLQRALRSVEHIEDPTERWGAARSLVAQRRREKAGSNGPRTWNVWDLNDGMQPDGVTKVRDIDGAIWRCGPVGNNGAWKMDGFDPEKHEADAAGWYVFVSLVAKYGPVTEIREG